jgi:hypothetical protein
MTRPDPESPDQGANPDDAVWLDLVARLEADSAAPRRTAATSDAAGTADQAGATRTAGTDPAAAPEPANATDGTETTARPAGFRDFDPLGLAGAAGAAPTELSAAERLAAAAPAGPSRGASGSASGGPSDGVQTAAGPRDYEADDDDGGFVPEEPPSLAGTDPLTMLAWLGAIGGPLALLLSAMFWRSAPLLAILGIVAAFVLAVVYLIMKLPQEKDDNDDGARV